MAKSPSPKSTSTHQRRARTPAFADLKDWLTLDEARRYLRLGHHSMRARVLSGDIPSRRFGRQYRIAKESLRP